MGWVGPVDNRQYWEVHVITWKQKPYITQASAVNFDDARTANEGHLMTQITIGMEGEDKQATLTTLRDRLESYGLTEVAALAQQAIDEEA